MIENELGLQSTYMVMLNSPCYDVSTETSKKILKQLLTLGHEVALHFDVTKSKRNDPKISTNDIEGDIAHDIKQLEQIIEVPVKSISFHRPLSQFLKGPLKIAGVINAYSKELMTWYLSDSAGRWREGEPLQKLLKPTNKLLQLLIHPIWWGEEHKNASERLEEFFRATTFGWSIDKTKEFDKALAEHISVRRANANAIKHAAESGKFDTDTNALLQRINSHEKFGNNDLNKWIFEHINIVEGDAILDLGCGTGKQTIRAAQLTKPKGKVIAFDISEKALDVLTTEARRLNLNDFILTEGGDLDDLEKYFSEQYFDHVIASYSLYYAKNPEAIFKFIHNHLKPGGDFFFCGPSKDNNADLKNFHNSLLKNEKIKESKSAHFMEETGMRLAETFFNEAEVSAFQNILEFNSADSLFNYWSSYNLYNENIAGDFRKAANKYFETNVIFRTAKCVIGIKAIK
ncbi:MAG TPA: class I SAM-dependent methyltransferase [Parafilimonas sp.]|nr:class I SAM-dependent methyltransferase [Parafilimonas sp.]